MKLTTIGSLCVLLLGACDPQPAATPVCAGPATPECGGLIFGTWKLACYASANLGATTVRSFPNETYTFNNDGTYTFDATGSDYTIVAPINDTYYDGTPYTRDCAEVAAAFYDGTCRTVGANCECTYATSGLALTATYSFLDTRVTLRDPFGSLTTGYCVEGDVLHLLTQVGNFQTEGTFVRSAP